MVYPPQPPESPLWRLLRRWQPAEGWATFGLLIALVLCFPAAVVEAHWVRRGDGGLLPTALLAFLVGRWVGRAGWRSRRAWPLLLPLGIGVSANSGGQLLPGWAALGEALQGRLPPTELLTDLLLRSLFFGQRLVAWFETVILAGGQSRDNQVFIFWLSLLTWTLAAYTARAFFYTGREERRITSPGGDGPAPPWGQDFATLFPIGLALTLHTYLAGEKGLLYLLLYLALFPLLLARGTTVRQEEDWARRGVDYSTEIGFEVGINAAAVAGASLVVAVLVALLTSPTVGRWAQDVAAGPVRRLGETLDRAFAGVSGGGRAGTGAGQGPGRPVSGAGVLPRIHLLGSGPELSRRRVMEVQTDDPTPHYWRGTVYDRYTGLGWEQTAADEVVLAADEPLLPTPPSARPPLLVQRVTRLGPPTDLLYAAPRPIRVDRPVRLRRYTSQDPAQMWALEPTTQYTVTSWVPTVTVAALRRAPAAPEEGLERYRQLPKGLPDRVVALARQVVEGATTPYDRARRLERFLRTYPYSLDIPPPPPGRDVADYFLFEAEAGYCDYYATAFVVMARAVGLPARLGVGYAPGRYDPETGRWLVTEAEAHSWPEVYFPGLGWVIFEPTAGRPPLERPSGEPAADTTPPEREEEGMPDLPLPPRPRPRAAASPLRYGLWLGGLLALGGLGGLWWRRRQRRLLALPAPDLVVRLYGQLQRQGARLGVPPQAGMTPAEYAARLAHRLQQGAARRRWRRAWWQEQAAEATAALRRLTELYVRVRYAGPAPGTLRREEAWAAWRALRLRLWILR